MKQKEYEKILQVLDDKSGDGIALMTLSYKTRIRRALLNSFLRTHKQCFSLVEGASKYRLNPASPCNGDVNWVRAILQEEAASLQQQNQIATWSIVLAIVLSLAISFGVIF